MKNLGPTDLKRLHREWRHKPHGRLAVLLDGVQQPYNVGAIVRTAAAERVDHLWIAGAGAVPPAHPTSRKVSLGTERYVEWSAHEQVEAAIDAAKDAGYQLVGLELAEGAVPLHEAALRDDVCLAIGHEDRGLSASTLAACDVVAFVPQLGKVGSLNVAQAAAMGIYEVRRRVDHFVTKRTFYSASHPADGEVMGTMDAVVGLLTVWTSISVVLVGTWHAHVGRRRPAFAVAEPRSHVQVVEHLAPVIDLDGVRSMRRTA